jgi:protein-glutamine gamma-glutamyltransferase
MGAVAIPLPARNVDRLFQFCLLGMVASGYFAVAGSGYLDFSTVVLTAFALIFRALVILDVIRIRFSATLVTVVTLIYIGFYPLDYLYFSKSFLPATVHLVFFLTITKVLTADSDRDYTYIKIIAFLELLAACLLSGRLNFFAFLAMYLVFAVGAFSSSEIRSAARKPVRVVRAGFKGLPLRLAALGLFISFSVLALTGGLFFFLPRTARAAFRHLVSERYHLPGFSNEVMLGQLGEIKPQSTTVMHVRFLPPSVPVQLKWRGSALSHFNGVRWTNDFTTQYHPIKIDRSGLVRLIDQSRRDPPDVPRLAYEVRQKDFGADTLFFAGRPEFLQINVPMIRRSDFNGIRLPLGISGEITYIAHVSLEPESPTGDAAAVTAEPLDAISRRQYLELPPLDPRIPRLALEMAAGATTPEARARAIEQHLRRDYGYTLTLLSQEVKDPLAYFLFERKKGHCEYFASAMAVMLRTLNIPTRVATGFQSGIYNPISGLQVIRASDAHSWVEAYLPRRGWTTFDPTPADPSAASASGFLTRFNLYMDAAETFWQDWVLDYDLDHQLTLASRVQDSSRSTNWTESIGGTVSSLMTAVKEFFAKYGAPIVAVLVLIFAIVFYGPAARRAWAMRSRMRRLEAGKAEASDATLLYNRMLRLLERRGIEKPRWITAGEFARTVTVPEIFPVVRDLTQAYHELRYGGRREAAPRMLALLEQLEK